ncbi:hypothetical protein L486_04572 [Kwoniella mangroviensis CBS 10435]|uniref:BZIP domain-containing protein n=1 Tax=Kwoniella mangroviensis CBS 10435 TaxID=1331196 RepID=A0A1B9ISN2_9TREE|nr:hypothetical protein L486_04572 [Kwoniella mangroviensis CBS 10435]
MYNHPSTHEHHPQNTYDDDQPQMSAGYVPQDFNSTDWADPGLSFDDGSLDHTQFPPSWLGSVAHLSQETYQQGYGTNPTDFFPTVDQVLSDNLYRTMWQYLPATGHEANSSTALGETQLDCSTAIVDPHRPMIHSSSNTSLLLQAPSAQPQAFAQMTSTIGPPTGPSHTTRDNTGGSRYSPEERKARNKEANKRFRERRNRHIKELESGMAVHEKLITQARASSQQATYERNVEQGRYHQLQALCRDNFGSEHEFTDEERQWIESEARRDYYPS